MISGSTPNETGSRGTRWVIAQSVLMTALVTTGAFDPADWHSLAGIGAGALLFASAAVVGITGVIQLGKNRTPYPRPRPGSILVRHGIYGWCRHPLYTSVMLAGFGWALLWQSAWTLVLAVLQIPFFMAKARSEERLLRQIFPAYEAYARQVKRFLPGVY